MNLFYTSKNIHILYKNILDKKYLLSEVLIERDALLWLENIGNFFTLIHLKDMNKQLLSLKKTGARFYF